jgi:hypothetical protein
VQDAFLPDGCKKQSPCLRSIPVHIGHAGKSKLKGFLQTCSFNAEEQKRLQDKSHPALKNHTH